VSRPCGKVNFFKAIAATPIAARVARVPRSKPPEFHAVAGVGPPRASAAAAERRTARRSVRGSRHRTNSRPSGRPIERERACLLAGGDTTPDYAPAGHGTAGHAKALKAVLTSDRADDER